MSSLKAHEKVVFERLFDRNGYVLDFNDRTFAEFFREHGIDINTEKYYFNGTSKMKRLRAFWEVETDEVVGRVLEALLQYACTIGEVKPEDKEQALGGIKRLKPSQKNTKSSGHSEADFLAQEFARAELGRLKLDIQLEPVVRQRIDEIHKSLKAETALATVFLCGSTLEGLLQDAASKQAQLFNQAKAAQKDKEGKVNVFQNWTLDSLINVAHEVGLLSLDVKKHSHALKDFRNYIHPREQAFHRFNPDMHTAKISWQILQAAMADISKQRGK